MSTKTAFVIILVVALGFIAYTSWKEDIEVPDLKQINIPVIKLEKNVKEKPGTVYKWQDKNGHWHYGENPPAGATAIPVDVYGGQNKEPVKIPAQ